MKFGWPSEENRGSANNKKLFKGLNVLVEDILPVFLGRVTQNKNSRWESFKWKKKKNNFHIDDSKSLKWNLGDPVRKTGISAAPSISPDGGEIPKTVVKIMFFGKPIGNWLIDEPELI